MTPGITERPRQLTTLNHKRSMNVIQPHGDYNLSDFIMPTTRETSGNLAVLESLSYLNTRLIPEVAPAHPPFERTFIETSSWLAAPKVIQLSLIVLTTSCQKSRTTLAPSLDKGLCQVRANCLNELKDLVSDISNERYGLTFDCIQLMMLAEMQLEPTGSWAYHLEAARRLIEVQGGLGSLFYKRPALRGMLINYMEIDIMATTTCPVRLLKLGDVSAQRNYIPLLAHCEKDTITTACFSPIPLLQSIVDINNFRVNLSRFGNPTMGISSAAAELTRILQTISTFDPMSWASRILSCTSQFPIPPPDQENVQNTAAMTTLAQCHQDAGTLYLYLSCASAAATLLQPHNLITIHTNLTANLTALLSQASSNTEDPVYTQLYKFAIWPLFVAAYARVGWNVGVGVDDAGSKNDLFRLRHVADAIESRPLRIAAELMERIGERRTGRDREATAWEWDDGFQGRSSFCVL